jgi:hypothetical protein
LAYFPPETGRVKKEEADIPENEAEYIHQPWELSTIRLYEWIMEKSHEVISTALLNSRLDDAESIAFRNDISAMVREIYEHGRRLQKSTMCQGDQGFPAFRTADLF